ncbi:hypothetical protein HELRODRAFT_62994 [Helobdella robusta]|uniref:Rho-GAP domain-containing protein n=1 Tax=Helobdella robusta TaxID=6412 RepID=T1FX92_HELRO|nr:hypothetical protein HELRODRAFT_62994 [Helobdella robusta]ESO12591.1 hypothetical protein HELRODRAFT_62994 [Helobdella robusta]
MIVHLSGMETEGVYRLSGQNSKVSKLLEILSEDVRSVTINQSDFQVHEVTNCLKRYLRQLDEPLFTSGFHPAWIEAQTIKDKNQRLILFKEILNSLPLINYATIKFIINHLTELVHLLVTRFIYNRQILFAMIKLCFS